MTPESTEQASVASPAPLTVHAVSPTRRRFGHWMTLVLVAGGLVLGVMIAHARAEDRVPPAFEGKIGEMRSLVCLFEDLGRVAGNASTAGVAAVFAANEQFKNNEDAIAFYEKVLPQTNDLTVRRAIRIKLIDLYKKAGEHEKATANLETLITGKGL